MESAFIRSQNLTAADFGQAKWQNVNTWRLTRFADGAIQFMSSNDLSVKILKPPHPWPPSKSFVVKVLLGVVTDSPGRSLAEKALKEIFNVQAHNDPERVRAWIAKMWKLNDAATKAAFDMVSCVFGEVHSHICII